MKITFIILSFICVTRYCFAQEYTEREYDLEQLLEEIFAIQDQDINYEILYENLAQILSNPIDLNTATEDQLRSLYILNEIQIKNFIAFRNENGALLSVYELQVIDGFDESTISKIIPFVRINSDTDALKSLLQRIRNEENDYLLMRYNRTLEDKRGFLYNPNSTTNYLGSPDRFYSRYRVARAGDFSFGLTVEKDAGETLNWSPTHKQYGFDYNSFHVQIANKGVFKNIILGDYQAQFGQGLILGGGFGVGKGAESITTIRRSNIGFLPYTSLNESGYFRGVAVSLQPANKLMLSTFFSSNWMDGASSTDTTNLFLSSISLTGLHRTENELQKRKIVLETNYGAVIGYRHRSLEVGAIFHETHFSIPIMRSPTLYNQFYFQGTHNTNVSLYLNYAWNNIAFFSEAAYTIGNGNAYVAGVLTSLTRHFDLAILYRNYARDFQSFYSNAFSENVAVQNESGYYLGWKYTFNKQHMVAGYSDLFQFPWLRYRGYTPSTGHEWLIRYTYQPSKTIFFYLQAREETKIRNYNESKNLYSNENATKGNYWINLDYKLSPQLSLKSRIQFSTYDFENSFTTGFALVQDANFNFKRVTLSIRYALFDTDDFDNRQYIYERDVWLAYSFPFYNGIGIRNYILVQYALNRNVDLWVRWSRIQYEDRETIGSGSETIEGNSMNDVKLQARIRF
ncbi:MAG: helix-hairpin-helix domain-containing protein [Cyclobacteriaceae bacterium]|nr:helix-hairpin-helix domain-containing protein [Cyclobacteriaceae bacterium]